MSTKIELAWAAGFIDGDGCFSILKGPKYWYFRLTVGQADPRPLQRLTIATSLGKVKGPYNRSLGRVVQSNTSAYNWTLTGQPALQAYSLVKPYLSEPKKEQAESCLVRLDMKKTIDGDK